VTSTELLCRKGLEEVRHLIPKQVVKRKVAHCGGERAETCEHALLLKERREKRNYLLILAMYEKGKSYLKHVNIVEKQQLWREEEKEEEM